ncbi:MAG: hypothetical protein LBP72_01030 [Dysgonamonadaceae bacterium]|nr:hypothetical protein [Dysgonamonadaceae bacterium]
MAKKKKKKIQSAHLRKTPTTKHSTTYLKSCYAVARRILQAVGEDESVFDQFTKRQKQNMFRVTMSLPRIEALPGHRVPKQYLRYIQEELMIFMKRLYFNEEYKVTWMDIISIGQPMFAVFSIEEFMDALPPSLRKIVDRLQNYFREELFGKILDWIEGQIKMTLLLLSQPNFRIYGQKLGGQHSMATKTGLQLVIHITTYECQSIRFKYHNLERTAYRVAMGEHMYEPYMGAKIAVSKIFPSAKSKQGLDIYIQSHAIHRFKERINTVYPTMRNEFFVISLMMVQRVVQAPNGRQLIACVMPADDDVKIIGYFAFTVDGNNLIVLTLLPLLSQSVPEGHILHKRLRLSNADMEYLGMDKLSFFYEVDIEQIPLLKQVLYDELHLDYIHTVYNSFRSKQEPFSEKKTLFVKNFFQKYEEQMADWSNEPEDIDDASVNALDDER